MNTTVVRGNVHWVGFVDWDVRDFHGYSTSRGSSYNAYLVKDKEIAVIDTVKAPYSDYLMSNISGLVNFEDIKYVVCNHAEPDHSGSLPILMEKAVNAVLVCNDKCKTALSMHFDTAKWKFKIVDETSTICLGENTLHFFNTPMAHWPESMATYIPEKKILFSMDAFGQHYASSGRFDYEENIIIVLHEAKKYYANIVMLYGKQIKAVLDKVLNYEIEIIAPSHGVIWKDYIKEILEKYNDWTEHKANAKVLIFFDTMWKSTSLMADAIYAGALSVNGVMVKKYDLKYTDITTIAIETLESASIAVGTPTLNKSLMPKVAEVLTYLKGLAPQDKAAIAFGSYGWAKKSGQHDVQEILKQMNCTMLLEEPVQSQYVPTPEVLQKCKEAGRMLAEVALKHK